MKNFIEILKRCPLFDDVDDNDLLSLLGCLSAKSKNFKKGQTIIEEGSRADTVGIVLSGTVRIERTDYYGNKSILTELNPPSLFGESFACAEYERIPVSVVSIEDSVVLTINVKKIITTCANSCTFHNRIIFNLLKTVAAKNILFNEKLEIIAKRTTREKLLCYLRLQSKKQGKNTFFIPFDRQALADYLEVDRSGLSAQISTLVKENVLTCKKNKFTLLK